MNNRYLIVSRVLSFWCAACIALGAHAQANEYVLHYRSIDQNGDSLTLSGKVLVPSAKSPKGVVLTPHYTISAKDEAPSVKPTAEAAYFKDDYVVLMPDYLGYGVTEDRIHPYLHGELTGHNCADMVIGAHALLDTMRLGISLDSIFIVGYSQGGASAVWTLKVIEEEFQDRIYVRHCFAGGGPYDVAVTFDDGLARNHIEAPMLVPMLLVGTDEAYNLHLDRSDFFTPAMEKNYLKYVKNKDHGIVSIFMAMPNHRLSHWLTPTAMDKNHPKTRVLYEGLRRSSLVGDGICPSWEPKASLYVFHSTQDKVVTVKCAEHFRRCYPNQKNITYDFGRYGHHVQASRVFFPYAKEVMDKECEAQSVIIRDTLNGVPCRVYLPSNDEGRMANGEKYPVLYLQHGMFGNEDDWTVQGRLKAIVDSLQRIGEAKEMVIVMPDNCPRKPSYEEEKANATNGEWEAQFAAFIKEAENKYPIATEPAQRAIAGLSMGGYHTMRVASVLDGQFDYVGMFSPATFVHEAPSDCKLLWLGIGKEDFLYDSVQDYRQWLETKHVEYTYYESEGGHTWPNWQDYLCRFLPKIFK